MKKETGENRTLQVKYSFIIPARNESGYIGRCIQSIKALPDITNYEIVVVDNGSGDNTVAIAKSTGVRVEMLPGSFVGAVRNAGAKVAGGLVLCFIDADCEVTENWIATIDKYYDDLISGKIGVLGAKYGLPPSSNLIQRSWFSHLAKQYVGSIDMVPGGNMVIASALFNSVQGFSEELTSGEDYDLCVRIRKRGYSVFHDYRLECLHYGNPESIKKFFNRERWHGKGMVADLKDPLSSRPLMISALYVGTYFLAAGFVFYGFINSVGFRMLPFLLIPFLLPAFCYSFLRSMKSSNQVYFPFLFFLYIIYSIARSFSLIEIFITMARNQKQR